jgi:hypothetical protein
MPLLGMGLIGIWWYRKPLRHVLLGLVLATLLISAAINLQGTLWGT